MLYEGLANITKSSISPSVLVVETDKQRFAMALKSEAIVLVTTDIKQKMIV